MIDEEDLRKIREISDRFIADPETTEEERNQISRFVHCVERLSDPKYKAELSRPTWRIVSSVCKAVIILVLMSAEKENFTDTGILVEILQLIVNSYDYEGH